MGIRLRRTVRLGKFARINLGKTGASLSLGGRGARVNIGKQSRATFGIPGTGLSYSTRIGQTRGSRSNLGESVTTQASGPIGCGTLSLAFIAAGFSAKAASDDYAMLVFFLVFGLAIWVAVMFHKRARAKREEIAEALRIAKLEQARREERKLIETYGHEAAMNILNKRLWIGCPERALYEMFGSPVSKEEKVKSSSVTRTHKYMETGKNRFALRVTLENGLVTGWDDKR